MFAERRSDRLEPERRRRRLISLIQGSEDHEDDDLEARRPPPRRRARAKVHRCRPDAGTLRAHAQVERAKQRLPKMSSSATK